MPIERRGSRFAQLAVGGLAIAVVLTGSALFGPEVDAQVVMVTFATMAVSAMGLLSVLVAPRIFGLHTVTAGGAFVASMNVLVLMGLPTTFANVRMRDPQHAVVFVVATLLSYLLVVGTMFVIDARVPRRDWTSRPIRADYLFPVIVLCGLVLAAYIVVAWPVPVIRAVLGARESELADLRAQSFALLEPALLRYLFGFVRIILLPFAAAVLVVRAMAVGSSLRWAVAMGVTGLAVLAAVANVEKSIVPRTMLIVFLAAMLANDGRRRPLLAAGAIGSGVLIPFLIAMQANSSSTSLLATFGALVRRVTVLPSEVVFEYFKWTGDNGHLLGASLPYVSYLVPRGPVSLSTVIYDSAFASYPGQVGSANGAYIGFLWADFGWVGVVFGSVLVGCVLGGLERVCTFAGRDAVAFALRAVVFVQVAQLPSTSVFSALLTFPFGLVDLVVLVLAWNTLARSGSFARLPFSSRSIPGAS